MLFASTTYKKKNGLFHNIRHLVEMSFAQLTFMNRSHSFIQPLYICKYVYYTFCTNNKIKKIIHLVITEHNASQRDDSSLLLCESHGQYTRFVCYCCFGLNSRMNSENVVSLRDCRICTHSIFSISIHQRFFTSSKNWWMNISIIRTDAVNHQLMWWLQSGNITSRACIHPLHSCNTFSSCRKIDSQYMYVILRHNANRSIFNDIIYYANMQATERLDRYVGSLDTKYDEHNKLFSLIHLMLFWLTGIFEDA